jgi:hypothetical protein
MFLFLQGITQNYKSDSFFENGLIHGKREGTIAKLWFAVTKKERNYHCKSEGENF